MTTMTAQDLRNLKAQANGTIGRGGEYVRTTPEGYTAKIGYVAGGSFCRAELRDAGGRLMTSQTSMMTHIALAAFVGMLNIAEQAPVQQA